MLMLPSSVRIYVASAPCDVRKSFDGLSILVQGALGQDPASGHLFCFFNRRATQVRILFWDRTGWCVFAKRLARGSFHLSVVQERGGPAVQVDAAELALLLEGIDLAKATHHRRFRHLPDALGAMSA